MGEDALVEIEDIGKRFGGVEALRDVTLRLRACEVHALCGENGAGKSTLIRILSGVVRPDRGRVRIDGRELPGGDVRTAEAAGIAVIHQESAALPDLSAIDNIFVGREPRRLGGLLLDRRAMRRQTRALLDELGETIDAHRPVGDLPVAQRQMVALARALSRRSRLLILDEPTASLSARETRTLFGIIRRLRERGVGILYVSHRLEEIFELADRVTVLRDGRWVATTPTVELDRASLVRMMVGREVRELRRHHAHGGRIGPAVLSVRGLTRRGGFHDVSFSLRRGEILGFAGLVGAGRSELARAVFGADRYESGRVEIDGRSLPPNSITAAMAAGIAMVPEDRQRLGLVAAMSVAANLTMAVLHRLTRGGLVDGRRELALAHRLIGEMGIRAAGPRAPAWTLSGGNQQKLVLGKWLAMRPRILILDEPTRGVDVAAKAEIHRLIRRLAAEGRAIWLISSELEELLSICDRIVVMRQSRLVGELDGAEADSRQVLDLALPQADEGGEDG